RREIFLAVRGLDFPEQTLERVEVRGLDLDRLGRGRGVAAEATEPAERRARLLIGHLARHPGVGGLRLRAAVPPTVQHGADQHDQTDLEQKSEERREASEAAKEAVAHQQADQAGAEQAAEQSTGKAAPEATEQSARLLRRRTRGRRGCGALRT